MSQNKLESKTILIALPELVDFIVKELGYTQKKISEYVGIPESTISEIKNRDKSKYKTSYRKHFDKIIETFQLDVSIENGGVTFKERADKKEKGFVINHSVVKKGGRLLFTQEIAHNPLILKILGTYIGFFEYNKGVIKRFILKINEDFKIQFYGGGYREGFLIIQEPNLFFVLFGDKVGNNHTSSEMLISKIGRRLQRESKINSFSVSGTWANEEGEVFMAMGVLFFIEKNVPDVKVEDLSTYPIPEEVKLFFDGTGVDNTIILRSFNHI